MKLRSTLFILGLIYSIFITYGMEYGLRFNSHSFPGSERTALTLGEAPFYFEDEFAIGFDIGFYDKDKFGIICTLTGNDGTTVSLVSSRVENSYHPALVINNDLHDIPVRFEATVDNPIRPILILKRSENKVVLELNKERYIFPLDMTNLKSVSVAFGANAGQKSVAPIEVCDIRIFIEKKNTHKWELRVHEGDNTIDDLSAVTAVAENAYWIIDDHIFLNKIYESKSTDRIQTAFNPKDNCFYIATSSNIVKFNPSDKKSNTIDINSDGRVMKHSNYLVYDTISDGLISYNIARKAVSRFNNSTWNMSEGFDDEPNYANHGVAFDDKYMYMFGGYGFYMYHNTLFRLNLLTDSIEEFTLSPLPDPRTSSSLCIYNGKLYLFGGLGNTVGKQEIPTKHYFDLWEYDLNTFEGQKLWETDTISYDFLPSSTMYYEPKDSAFYLASTLFGGCMMKIPINSPSYEVVSEPIHSEMEFRDCVFNLYQSISGKIYYLVIDKRLDDNSHDYAIYTITYPFCNNLLYDSYKPSGNKKGLIWHIILGGVILCVFAFAVIVIVRNRRLRKSVGKLTGKSVDCNNVDKNDIVETADATFQHDTASRSAHDTVNSQLPALDIPINENTNCRNHYNRDCASISLLGKFNVKDKTGNDITPKFSARIKDLLILLILCSERDEKGINFQKLDEVIWPDKFEKSAKNNRNVYMRKLRLLLEEVGNAEIVYDKGYYRLNCNDVFIDYHESVSHIKHSASGSISSDFLEETFELLIMGPLLPNSQYEWLDDYKSEYTDISLKVLYRLLEFEKQKGNHDYAYRLAETIMQHDKLNEEALITMCKILSSRKMKGPAKNLYDNFCREYKKSYGEDYSIQFADIFKIA